jgi:DNA-directed RNA polymerase specialized sigma subunit
MAKKDTKRYLNQLRTYQFIIDHKLAELYRLETMATKTTVALQGDRVQTSPSDKLSEAMAKIVDLKDEIAEGYNEYIEKRRVIMGQIESLEDDEYKKVLILRYDECLPFDKMPERLSMSRRTVFRIHDKALDAFEKEFLMPRG